MNGEIQNDNEVSLQKNRFVIFALAVIVLLGIVVLIFGFINKSEEMPVSEEEYMLNPEDDSMEAIEFDLEASGIPPIDSEFNDVDESINQL